jgi:phosphoserine phosphatase
MRLVIQGQCVLPEQLAHITRLANENHFQIAEHAYRFAVAKPIPEIATYCEAQHLDCAFVPDEQHLERIRLVVMDMDSTLIAIECIDEIADMVGLKSQVAEITESAMHGKIEFAESLYRRVALLKGLDENALQRVYDERLRLNPGAEFMLTQLQKHGIKTLLVSGGFTFFTERLKTRLKLDYAYANTLEITDSQLTGKTLGNVIDAQGKADALNVVREELGLTREQVVAIGDGANDLKMMSVAGAGVAYHAKPVVRAQASYALNHVGLEGIVHLFSQ